MYEDFGQLVLLTREMDDIHECFFDLLVEPPRSQGLGGDAISIERSIKRFQEFEYNKI